MKVETLQPLEYRRFGEELFCKFSSKHWVRLWVVKEDENKESPDESRVKEDGVELRSAKFCLDDQGSKVPLPKLYIDEEATTWLEPQLQIRSGCRLLRVQDCTNNRIISTYGKQTDTAHDKFVKLSVNVFFMGFHVCIVNTRQQKPQELLGCTLDYVEFTKEPLEQTYTFKLHHFQIDDFSVEDKFIIGPADCGLNSEKNEKLRLGQTVHPVPFFFLEIQGPKDRGTFVIDPVTKFISLDLIKIHVGKILAHLDMTRLIALIRVIVPCFVFSPYDDNTLTSLMSSTRNGGDTGVIRNKGQAHGKTLRHEATPRKTIVGNQSNAHSEEFVKSMRVAINRRVGRCKINQIHISDLILMLHLANNRMVTAETGEIDEDDDLEDIETRREVSTENMPPEAVMVMKALWYVGGILGQASPKFALPSISLQRQECDVFELALRIVYMYKGELLRQLLGSAWAKDQFGDPVALWDDIQQSVAMLLDTEGDPALGIESQSVEERLEQFAAKLTGSGFGAVAKISSSFRAAFQDLRGGNDVAPHRQAETVDEGMNAALDSLMESYQCTESGQGVGGALLKPVEGFWSALESFTEGVSNHILGAQGGYNGLRRPPRTEGLVPLHESLFWPKYQLRVASNTLTLRGLAADLELMEVLLSLEPNQTSTSPSAIIFRREWNSDLFSTDDNAAIGRIGRLRSPATLYVWGIHNPDALHAQLGRKLKPFQCGLGVDKSDGIVGALASSSVLDFQVTDWRESSVVPLGSVSLELSCVAAPEIVPDSAAGVGGAGISLLSRAGTFLGSQSEPEPEDACDAGSSPAAFWTFCCARESGVPEHVTIRMPEK